VVFDPGWLRGHPAIAPSGSSSGSFCAMMAGGSYFMGSITHRQIGLIIIDFYLMTDFYPWPKSSIGNLFDTWILNI
jgi:hypothetical protein